MRNELKKMRVVDRDYELLRWINSVGFVSIEHIAMWMRVVKSTAYVRMKKLTNAGYLIHEYVFYGEGGVYRLTNKGVQLCNSNLPYLSSISAGSYRHDLAVTKLNLDLSRHLNCSYVPEREIRHEKGVNNFGQVGHTPDGVLSISSKKIAIELELNKKGLRRREKIVSWYMKNFEFDQVWYFCGTREIAKQMNSFTGKAKFLSIFSADNWQAELSNKEYHNA